MVWNEENGATSRRKRLWFGAGCFLLWSLSFQQVRAQTFGEWFQQRETQVRYLVEQVAALHACENDLRRYYHTCREGWRDIAGHTGGELDLHSDYYHSLGMVDASVRNSPDVHRIRREADAIKVLLRRMQELQLTEGRQLYVEKVATGVLLAVNADITRLQGVLSDGVYQMTDDQRLKFLIGLQAAMLDRWQLVQDFYASVRVLQAKQNGEMQEAETFRRLYGHD